MDGVNSTNWLPDGWIMEQKRRKSGATKGLADKYFIEAATGRFFRSKLQVLRYLKTEKYTGKLWPVKLVSNNKELTNGESMEKETSSAKILQEKVQRTLSPSESGQSSDWLPPGWTIEIKTRKNGVSAGMREKFYIELATGKKFASRLAVLRYLTDGNASVSTPRTNMLDTGNVHLTAKEYEGMKAAEEKGPLPENSSLNSTGIVPVSTMGAEELPPDWLPTGWMMETKVRKRGKSSGAQSKFYIELATGQRFTSRLAVLRYLENGNASLSRLKRKKHDATNIDLNMEGSDAPIENQNVSNVMMLTERKGPLPEISPCKSSGNVMVSTCTKELIPEWLPPGWATEISVRKSGKTAGRREKFYIELATGQRFGSRLAVLRYLTNGNASPSGLKSKELGVPNIDLNMEESDALIENLKESTVMKTTQKKGSLPEFSPSKSSGNVGVSTVCAGELTPEWLPPGWTMVVTVRKAGKTAGRREKFYIELATGQRFASRLAVVRYLENGNASLERLKSQEHGASKIDFIAEESNSPFQKRKESTVIKTKEKKDPLPEICPTNSSGNATVVTSGAEELRPEWLPPGWTMQIKVRKSGKTAGMREKYYIDPATGCSFRSRVAILRYVKTKKPSATKQKKPKTLSPKSSGNVMATTPDAKEQPPEWLPPGWTMEIKERKSGKSAGLREKYYIDPATGRSFRSRIAIVRYIEAGKLDDPKQLESKTHDVRITSLTEIDSTPSKVISEVETRRAPAARRQLSLIEGSNLPSWKKHKKNESNEKQAPFNKGISGSSIEEHVILKASSCGENQSSSNEANAKTITDRCPSSQTKKKQEPMRKLKATKSKQKPVRKVKESQSKQRPGRKVKAQNNDSKFKRVLRSSTRMEIDYSSKPVQDLPKNRSPHLPEIASTETSAKYLPEISAGSTLTMNPPDYELGNSSEKFLLGDSKKRNQAKERQECPLSNESIGELLDNLLEKILPDHLKHNLPKNFPEKSGKEERPPNDFAGKCSDENSMGKSMPGNLTPTLPGNLPGSSRTNELRPNDLPGKWSEHLLEKPDNLAATLQENSPGKSGAEECPPIDFTEQCLENSYVKPNLIPKSPKNSRKKPNIERPSRHSLRSTLSEDSLEQQETDKLQNDDLNGKSSQNISLNNLAPIVPENFMEKPTEPLLENVLSTNLVEKLPKKSEENFPGDLSMGNSTENWPEILLENPTPADKPQESSIKDFQGKLSKENPTENLPEKSPENKIPDDKPPENSEINNPICASPFGDSWNDPCLDFAVKTLTGEIPVVLQENPADGDFFL
ncbi:uncharacterized protein LOC18423079 isoform X2 [Amborella trichopoda]|uniref:uncharacterized protein LOC18423079 isoform X2 n=1 Tax=Amborella trichopoda TaxID=13333 RepID=UPI0005D4461C|nr:uncharacterized protein LOC18423079 isoform X2 [Amborella trichopoda]|eukprot:XP_011625334.1 uncharacterized protein LOC18423079 isoform X2 [Amborella trichopoda]